MSPDFLHELPADIEAEEFVLGSILLAHCIPPEAESLQAEDFSLERFRLIFRAMLALGDLGRPIEYLTLAEALEARGDLERCRGRAGIAGLTDGLPQLDHIGDYVRIVKNKATLRRLIANCHSIEQAALDPGADPAALTEQLQARLNVIVGDGGQDPTRYSIDSLSRQFEDFADHIDEHRLPLGLGRFDEVTGGVAPGEVVTLLARTGVGKSAIAQNVTQNVLDHDTDAGAVFVSLEMPRILAFQRQLQIFSGLTGDQVVYSYRNQTERARADEFEERYNGRLLIVDDAGLDLAGIERYVRGAQAAKLVAPVKLVVIDYLGLLDHGGRGSLTERISTIARAVKQTAKKLDAVVLLIAQTSRSAGDGSDEVTVTDARDSGAVEDSADFLLGAWRPELKGGISPDELVDAEGKIWFSTLKARRGRRAKWFMHFDGSTMRIRSEPERARSKTGPNAAEIANPSTHRSGRDGLSG